MKAGCEKVVLPKRSGSGMELIMKKRMKFQLIVIALVAILLTMTASLAVFFDVFRSQVKEDLCTYTHLLKETGAFSDVEAVPEFLPEEAVIRVTWIAGDGTVLYDNDASVGEMENHMERPEVKAAVENGEGYAIRNSDTLGEDTYYYALLMPDGSILRSARETDSVWSLFTRVLLMAFGIAAVLIVVSVVLADFLTRQFMRPLKEMTSQLDRMGPPVSGYEEMQPFLTKIRQQHEGILAASKMRQDFTANVTHELKTPLTAISGYSEIIENRMAEGEEAVSFAKKIHQNANRLLNLINDILKLSELDSASDKIMFQEVSLTRIAGNCVELLRVNAASYGVSLNLDGEEVKVKGDSGLLEELVYNLISNGMKYNSDGGHVWVYTGKESGHAVLEVKDDGIGIPAEHQSRVFERFYRVDKSRSKQIGGTGLGLAICKHIVMLHDAKISLESEPGKGTGIKIIF